MITCHHTFLAETLYKIRLTQNQRWQTRLLKDYRPPIADGMGAKFVFPRMVDGQPLVTPDSGYVRFYAELTKDLKLNMRFKVPEMMFDGQLEY